MASRALTARLMIASSNCEGSASAVPKVLRQRCLQRNVLADRPLQHGRRALDGFVHVENARLQGLLAGECQHALHELNPALGGIVDLLDHVPKLGVARNADRDQLRHADDDRENVVEIVGDATGQLADRLHLLSLAQLQLDFPAIGDPPDPSFPAIGKQLSAVHLAPLCRNRYPTRLHCVPAAPCSPRRRTAEHAHRCRIRL